MPSMSAQTSGGRRPSAGSGRRIPLSGWRGEPHPDRREDARCPYCGEALGPSSTAWCPGFDEILARAALELARG